MARDEERGTGPGDTEEGHEDPTVRLPDWRDPPTGEIPRIIEELAGEPLPNWRVEDTGRIDAISDDSPPDQLGIETVEIRPAGAPRPSDGHGEDEALQVDQDTLGRARDGRVSLESDETLVLPPRGPRHRMASEGAPASGDGPLEVPPRRGDDGWGDLGGAPRRMDDAGELVSPPATDARGRQSDGPKRRPTRQDVVASRRRQRAEEVPAEVPPAPVASGRGRSKTLSTATGIVLGALVLAALARGPVTTLVVVVVALSVAAGEGFVLLRRAGLAPMALLGIASVAAISVFGYLDGAPGVLAAVAVSTVLTLVWFVLLRGGRYLLRGFAPTQALVLWIGLFGGFAALLLRRSEFGPDGLGLLIGVLATAVSADVFAFFGGSLVGRHPLAPQISPGKTVEGVVIGGVAAVLVGMFGVARMHPFDLASGLALGILAAVVVPLGDLAESALKRLVDAKDSSRLLPGHGGMLDRIDGILLLLPCAYALFMLTHLA